MVLRVKHESIFNLREMEIEIRREHECVRVSRCVNAVSILG
jgi:hypothetical protein